jgi:hypothetical protein
LGMDGKPRPAALEELVLLTYGATLVGIPHRLHYADGVGVPFGRGAFLHVVGLRFLRRNARQLWSSCTRLEVGLSLFSII